MKEQLRPAALFILAFTLLTGVLYPLAMTGVAQLIFPHQAEGSLIRRDGAIIGSSLIGQNFDGRGVFWSRPSATTPAYNAGSSSGSNLGPLNPDLEARVQERIARARAVNPGGQNKVPVDLVTTSGSGLDPDISPAAAQYQVARVARETGLDAAQVKDLVAQHTQSRQFGVLGEPRVNVLELNLAVAAALRRRSVTRPTVQH